MEGFDHLLNWKLKAGSHPFPRQGWRDLHQRGRSDRGWLRVQADPMGRRDAGLLLAPNLPVCDAAERLGLRERPATTSPLRDPAGLR